MAELFGAERAAANPTINTGHAINMPVAFLGFLGLQRLS